VPVVLWETVGVVTVTLVGTMLQVLLRVLLLVVVAVRLWVLLGVPPERLQGVVLGVLGEARLRRMMEVGHLELVVVVTHRALQFGSRRHRAVGLQVVGVITAQVVVVILGGRAQFAHGPGVGVGVGVAGQELGLAGVVGPKHIPGLSFTFLS